MINQRFREAAHEAIGLYQYMDLHKKHDIAPGPYCITLLNIVGVKTQDKEWHTGVMSSIKEHLAYGRYGEAQQELEEFLRRNP